MCCRIIIVLLIIWRYSPSSMTLIRVGLISLALRILEGKYKLEGISHTILVMWAKKAVLWEIMEVHIPLIIVISSKKDKLEFLQTKILLNFLTIGMAGKCLELTIVVDQLILKTLLSSFQIRKLELARDKLVASQVKTTLQIYQWASTHRAIRAIPVSWATYHQATKRIEMWKWTNFRLSLFKCLI